MGYVRAGTGLGFTPAELGAMRLRGLRGIRRGMGDVMCPDGSSQPTLSDCVSAGDWGSSIDLAGPGGSVGVPAGTGPDWTQFWQNLTTSGVKILGSVVTPPAYQQVQRDAYGNIISTTVRAATPNTALTAAAGGLPAISSNTLLIGGGVLIALVLAMSMGKRG